MEPGQQEPKTERRSPQTRPEPERSKRDTPKRSEQPASFCSSLFGRTPKKEHKKRERESRESRKSESSFFTFCLRGNQHHEKPHDQNEETGGPRGRFQFVSFATFPPSEFRVGSRSFAGGFGRSRRGGNRSLPREEKLSPNAPQPRSTSKTRESPRRRFEF